MTGAFGIVFVGTAIANGFYAHMSVRFATAIRGTLVSMICLKTVDLRIGYIDESAAVTLMSTDTGWCPCHACPADRRDQRPLN